MRCCLELAMSARLAGISAVGSIVVRNNEAIAEATQGDKTFPPLVAHAVRLAVIPQALFRDFDGTGHDIHWEEPAPFYYELNEFFLCAYKVCEVKAKIELVISD